MKQKIILATTSPRRQGLAQTMGLDFEIVPSNYEENMKLNLKPKDLVMQFAHGKALDVSKKFKEGIVIGIDTIIVFNNKNLGKPKTKEEAFKMLKSYSGKKQYVYSGVCLIDCKTKKIIKDFEVTEVYFKKLEDNEIKNYIATGEPMDKAGGYGIQDLASIFIKKINGCYFNVMGFPIYNIYKNLRKMNVNIFDYDRWKGK
ncbi:MAG: Maf family protein [Candidatus Pacearchaeota archaeon]|jgi:septum formation protein